MGTTAVARNLVKAGLRLIGLDLLRARNSPRLTLLGLKQMPIRSIIDVGANTGQFARDMRHFFPKATIYCFEPLTDPFRKLAKWSATQGGYVRAFNLALGESSGEIPMFWHIDHTPSSSLLASTDLNATYYPCTRAQRSCSVRIARLDDVMAEAKHPLAQDMLLKLDVQGYEDRVLRGATETLRSASAVVLEVCLDPLYKDQSDFLRLASFLADSGFEYAGNLSQSYGSDGHVIWLDALFRKRPTGK
jgi:FkbM family methyltransferase